MQRDLFTKYMYEITEIFYLTAKGHRAEQEPFDPYLLSGSKYPNILHTMSEHKIFLCMNI